MITYKIKVIWIFWIVERFFCKPWRDVVTLHRLSIADGIGKANAGQPSRSTAHPGSKRPEVRATYISSLGSPVGLWFYVGPTYSNRCNANPVTFGSAMISRGMSLKG